MKRASLAEIRTMREAGKLYHNPNAPVGQSLGPDFWNDAVVVEPQPPTSVHLKLDPEVFEFFKRGGKGHLTRMQNVLKAYVETQKRKTG
jgi:uncharacterized protein (DUF4415 family)